MKIKLLLLFCFFLFIGDYVSAQGPNPQVGMRVSGNKNPNTLCEGDTLYLMNLTQDSSRTVKYYVFNWNWKNESFYPLYQDTIYNKDSVYHIYNFHDSVVYKNCRDRSKKLYVSLTAVDTFNDEFEIVSNIVLFLQPRVNFSGPSDACVGEEVTFTSTTCPIDTGFLFKWELDGKTFTTENIKYTFNNPGRYKIKLNVTATNPCSKSDSFVRYIDIVGYPNAALDLYTLKKGNTICFGKDTLTAVNLSTNYTSATWLFNPNDTLKFKLVKNSNLGSDTVFFVPLSIDSFTVQLRVCNYKCCDTTSKYKFKSIISPEVKIKNTLQCVRDTGIILYDFLDTTAGFPDAFQWFLTGVGYSDSGYTLPKTFKKLNYGQYTFKFNSNGVCDTFSHQTTFIITPKIERLLDTLKICNSVDLDYPMSSFFKNIPANFGAKWSPDSLLNNYAFNAFNRNAGTYKIKLIDTLSNCYNDSILFVVFKSSPQRFNDTGFCLLKDSASFTSIEKGEFVGAGVTNNTFYPAAVGIGTYSIVFKSDSTLECPYSDTFLVTVHDTIKADFSYSSEGCKGVPIVFKKLSSSQVNYWDMGDNTKSYDSIVSKVYTSTGKFKVKLVIGTNGACRDSIEKNIEIFDSPTLTYAVVVDSSRCDSIYITYSILNIDSNQIYKWTINQDSFFVHSLVQQVERLDIAASYMPYYVLSTNLCGAISDSGVIRIPPKFNGSVSLVGANKQCTPYTASLNYNIYGTSDSFIVNYGNGQWSKNVINSMTYFNAGTTDTQYIVRLTAYNSKCGNAYDSLIITVAPNNIKPAFTVNNPGCKNTDFNFINTSPDSIQIWNFGDTKTSSLQNPTHQYTTAGTFTVKAIYFAPFGCTDTLEREIIVFDKPIINHKYTVDSTDCDSVKIILMVTNPDTAQNYTWRVGLDTFYNDTINYTVPRLAKIDSFLNYAISSFSICGAFADSGKIRIPPKFNSNLKLNGASKKCTPFVATFSNNFYGKADSFLVDYGNGQSSKNMLNSMTYYNAGTVDSQYVIKLIAYSGQCISALDSVSITVAPNNIKPSFTVNNPGCKNTDFNFVNTSPDSIQIWNFGDAKTSTLQDPTHQYTTAGTFKVQANYIAPFGCTDTLEKQIIVFDKPIINHRYAVDSIDCDSVKIILMVTNPDTAQNYSWRVGLDTFYNDTINYTVARLAKIDSFLNYAISSFSICGAIADSGKIRIPPQFNSKLLLNGAGKKCTPFVATFSNNFYGKADSFLVDYGNGQSSKNVLNSMTYYNAGTVDTQYVIKLVAYSGQCISALDSVIITVAPNNIKPAFTVNNPGCKNTDFNFVNTSPDSIQIWNFGDTKTSSLQDPTHQYTTAGTFKVQANYIAPFGCKDTLERQIIVFDKPLMNHKYTIDSTDCDSIKIRLLITNPDTAQNYTWRVGLDSFYNDTIHYTVARLAKTNFFLNYTISSFSICGTIADSGKIRIPPQFNSSLKLNGAGKKCTPFIATFSNSFYGKADSFLVDYGNGQSSKNVLKSMTYYNSGTVDSQYVIKLIAYSGQCISAVDSVIITVAPNNIQPTFSVNNAGCKNIDMSFNNTSSDSIVMWYFGDGDSSNLQSPTHKYTQIGNYTVSAIYTANWGCMDSSSKKVRVIEPPISTVSYSLDSSKCDTLLVDIKVLNPDTLNTYQWFLDTTFISNKTNETFNIVRRYTEFYQPYKLTTTNICGTIDNTDSIKVTVGFRAKVAINGKNTGCSPFIPSIDNFSTGKVSYYWVDYGNGDTSVNRIKPTTYYNALPSTKRYPVVITAFNQLCDSLKDTTYVYVQPIKVKPYAQYSKTDHCLNEQVTFINNSSPEADVRLFWGDGFTVDRIKFGDTLRHNYSKPGNYFVTVEATSCGVDTSAKYPIVIEDFPKANFVSEPAILCVNQEIKFKKLGDSAFVRNWRVQSKDTAYRQDSFSKFFTQTGLFDVELIVESPLGKCRDSITRTFTLNPKATMTMNPSSQINCSPHVVCVSVKGNIDKYFIDWGNGLVGNNLDTCTVYNSIDTAKVKVSGSTPFGCPIVDSFYVHTYPSVATKYTITVDSSACDFVKVNCKIINPKPLINYKWYYNSTSYDTTSTEIIIQKGQNYSRFAISLNASNYCGSSTYYDTIPIGLKWKARLGVSGNNIGCTPFTASFINHSLGQVDSFVVNYGDNTSSKNTLLTKTFINNDDTVKTFRVVLTQFNNQCFTSSDTVFIQVYPNNIKLAVEYNQTSYCKNEEVKFVNRSLDKAALIFFFGDGTSLSGNFNYGDTIKHNYFAIGQYNISVKTLIPCNGDSVHLYTVVINEIPALDFDSDRTPICSSTDLIFKTVSTNVSNLVWTIDNVDTIKNSNPINYNFQTAGLHNVSLTAVSSINGCANTITKNYTVYPFTDYRLWIDTPICEGQLVCAHLRGDIEKMTINWGNNNFGNITDTCTKYLKSGSYTVNITTTSYLGCYDQTQRDLYVHPPPKVEILPDRAFIDLAIGSSLTLSFDSNQNYRKYYWLSNNDTFCNNLDANCRELNIGPFWRTTEENFKLILQDEYGCFGEDQILIKNSSAEAFYVPNAFSPNKDGINETFRPIILDYKIEAYDMYVFNRWGEILYKALNSPIDAMGWDGYYLDKKCESELYNVLIKFKTNQGIDKLTYKGYIMLVD